MNKSYFQSMFSSTIGCVYEYLGSIPEESTPLIHITQELISIMGSDLFSIVVSISNGKNVVYTNNPIAVEHQEFQLLVNLTPDPVFIPEPPVEPLAEEQETV